MLHQLSIKMRFTIIVTALVAGFAMFGMWTFYAMNRLNVNGPVYQRIIQGKDLVADVLPPPEYIIESYLTSLQLNAATEPAEISYLISRFQLLKAEYDVRHAYWLKQSLAPELKKTLLQQSYQEAQQFYQEAEDSFLPAIQTKDTATAQLSMQKMRQAYEKHREAIDDAIRFVNERIKQDEVHATAEVQWNNMGLVSVFMLSVLIAVVLTWLISRGIIRQLGGEPVDVAAIAANIAQGKLDNDIPVNSDDKHSVVAQMQFMQQKLLSRRTDDAHEKASSSRIYKALDKASSNVMMADRDYTIIYINEALKEMFQKAQQDIRKELPLFDADKLLGANIDIFHKKPSHQRAMLDRLNSTLHSNFVIGGRHMNFIANPVFDDRGERLGTVVEWQDRTAEVKVENEIKSIIAAVKAGELHNRLNIADKTGFFQTLSTDINNLTEVIEQVFNDVASAMQSMAAGDLTNGITHDYEGIYGSCKDDINATIAKLSEVFMQIKHSAEFINNSSQEIASGNNNLSQRAEEQAASLEQTASSMEELTSTVKNNADNAQQANQVATSAQDLAEKGGSVVNSAVRAMQEINDSSNKIAAIIGVIDEIAFQTNLLALNASVEAARAGEHGRGFSVVATEVRNLAQRSATAARESKELIQNSIQKVRAGTQFVNETGHALTEIVTGVKQVGAIIAEIASASAEQSAGIEQVNQAVAQMDEITQQNAALAEQAAAASVSMSEQTTNMAHLLAFFEQGSSAAIVTKPAALPPPTAASIKTPPQKSIIAKAMATTSDNDDEWDDF